MQAPFPAKMANKMLTSSSAAHQTNLFGTDLLLQLDPNDPRYGREKDQYSMPEVVADHIKCYMSRL